MIDFHTHIIPNIDDGSRSIEETFNLIQEAKDVGFDGIILTSHYIENYYETDVPERDVWVKAISDNLKEKGIETNLLSSPQTQIHTYGYGLPESLLQ